MSDVSEHPEYHLDSIAIKNAADPNHRAVLKANPGKIRVVGVDTFDHGDWVYAEYDTLEEAVVCAEAHGGTMLKTHVYDDTGKHLHEAGTF